MADAYDFVVKQDDLRSASTLPLPAAEEVDLEPGEVLLRVDNFSITANNVTYAAMGEAMRYWEFFPAPEGFGRIPVWGYSEVVRSDQEGIPVGSRIYGYMPISSHFTVRPESVSETGFVDSSPHRAELPAIYNRYGFTTAETGDTPDREPYIALFGPLFATSYLLADQLDDEKFGGATRLVLSSASSKTALALAFLLQRDHGDAITVVGLTSAGNAGFVEGTGLYDQVVRYEDLEGLDPDEPTAYLDFGGSAKLRARVHGHFGEHLTASTVVGAADWEELAPDPDAEPLAGPRPGFFFAPDRFVKRNKEWGAAEVRRRIAASQNEFIDSSRSWLTIRSGQGPDEIEATLMAFLDGRVDPAEGWSMRP
ncbi:MAG TPA: DUF2855 family protein [Solirubrobacterales bacterium]|nr:DUF2855 family protein [Solirubrobacterales bacterium]